jgi:protein-disulfide isomerase
MFFDIQCPDSAAAWPTMLSLLKQYPKVRFRVVLSPLPYHLQSFRADSAAQALYNLGGGDDASLFVDILTQGFANQQSLFNQPSANLTLLQVQENLYHNVLKKIPQLSHTSFEDFVAAWVEAESPMRVQWKYGVKKGVYGTPFYVVNGLSFPQEQFNSYTIEQWKVIFDQLE